MQKIELIPVATRKRVEAWAERVRRVKAQEQARPPVKAPEAPLQPGPNETVAKDSTGTASGD